MIDLRSDTVTLPTPEMRAAMANAEVGDDVYGEDPTVNQLQERVAAILGKEAALFVPSGVMANQISLKCSTNPGDEVILEEKSHIFNYETAGAAFLANVQLRPVRGTRGVMAVEDVEAAIRADVYYNPRSTLVCVENTHNGAGGTIYSLNDFKRLADFAHAHGMRVHLDGARIWNASVATGMSPAELSRHADTVSVCFSKGLGAPVGSAIAGSAADIRRARTIRKIYGGGMRQAGIIAAGALFALEHNVSRLSEDHAKAQAIGARVAAIRELNFEPAHVQTNIVVVDVAPLGLKAAAVVQKARTKGVMLSDMGPTAVRAVTHMNVSMEEVERAAEVLWEALSGRI